MHKQEGMIQLFAAAICPFLDILLQQIAESYLLAVASLSKLTRPLLSATESNPTLQYACNQVHVLATVVFNVSSLHLAFSGLHQTHVRTYICLF